MNRNDIGERNNNLGVNNNANNGIQPAGTVNNDINNQDLTKSQVQPENPGQPDSGLTKKFNSNNTDGASLSDSNLSNPNESNVPNFMKKRDFAPKSMDEKSANNSTDSSLPDQVNADSADNTSGKLNITKSKKDDFDVKDIDSTVKSGPVEQKIMKNLANNDMSSNVDPFALVDESIVNNKMYDQYLDKKIETMDKLVSYYKKKEEYDNIISLFEKTNGKSAKEAKDDEIKNAVTASVQPLQAELSTLKDTLTKFTTEKAKNDEVESKNKDFSTMQQSFKDLVIYTMGGQYIAVVHTDSGDAILKPGNYYNSYLIKEIKDDTIIFEKDNKTYYHNQTQKLNSEYLMTKIEIPNATDTKVDKTATKDGADGSAKEYKTTNMQDVLDEKLQNFNKKNK
jgi:hypothetical protein